MCAHSTCVSVCWRECEGYHSVNTIEASDRVAMMTQESINISHNSLYIHCQTNTQTHRHTQAHRHTHTHTHTHTHHWNALEIDSKVKRGGWQA